MLIEQELKDLRDEVMEYLNITWSDEMTDKKILGFVKDGEQYLNATAGTEINFLTDLKSKQLLKDYVRYVYNHSFELFKVNFQGELFDLSLREGINSYAEEKSETST